MRSVLEIVVGVWHWFDLDRRFGLSEIQVIKEVIYHVNQLLHTIDYIFCLCWHMTNAWRKSPWLLKIFENEYMNLYQLFLSNTFYLHIATLSTKVSDYYQRFSSKANLLLISIQNTTCSENINLQNLKAREQLLYYLVPICDILKSETHYMRTDQR